MSAETVYLDYNASTPLDPRVLTEMLPYLTERFGNAASVHHAFGQVAAASVERARDQVAALLGATPNGVIFTSGATEANNTVLKGLGETSPEGRSRIVISAGEHASVRAVAEWFSETGRLKVDVIPLTSGGQVDTDALAANIGPDVLLVSVMAANSETGVLNPVETVADLARGVGAIFHCDATQIVGRAAFDMTALGVDALSMSGHKIYGPQGIGAIAVTRSVRKRLAPLMHGGHHEGGLRSGTANVAGSVGMGAAASLAGSELDDEVVRLANLRDRLWELLAAGLDGITTNGDEARRLPNTLNVRIAGAMADAVLANAPSVAASTGSACTSGAPEPSVVLLAMGIDRVAADEAIRFSVGRFTTESEIDRAATAIIEAAERVRRLEGGDR